MHGTSMHGTSMSQYSSYNNGPIRRYFQIMNGCQSFLVIQDDFMGKVPILYIHSKVRYNLVHKCFTCISQ